MDGGPFDTDILYMKECGMLHYMVLKGRGLAPCKLTRVTGNLGVGGSQNHAYFKGLPC